MKIHHFFHVSLFELHKESDLPGRSQTPLHFKEIDNHEEYEVEKVFDSRRRRDKLEYLVHWRGYNINERTWKAATNLINAPQKVHEFHQLYLDKPRK